MKKKKFSPIASDDTNYITRVTELFSKYTDAPKDIHEVYALFHLAAAAMDLRWEIRDGSGKFVRLNLYFAYSGESTEARKSTCMELNRGFLNGALSFGPTGIEPFFRGDTFTPQGLRDGMEDRQDIPTIVALDEMDDIFEAISDKRSPMAGLPHMFKTLYTNSDYYTRLSKRGKAAGSGDIMIKDSYLCMIGNITPAAPKRIAETHLSDGFFARIHIVKATEEYKRMSKYNWALKIADDPGLPARMQTERRNLQTELAKIQNSIRELPEDSRVVTANMGILKAMNDYENQVEAKKKALGAGHPGNYSLARIQDTLAKVATLIAVGRMGGDNIKRNQGIIVTEQDVIDAGRFCDKLIDNSLEFIRLAAGSTDLRMSLEIVQMAMKVMDKSGKDYFLDQDIIRRARNKYNVKEVKDLLIGMARAGDILMHPIPGGKPAYKLSSSFFEGKPDLRYEPVAKDKNEDPKIPGEDTPF